jgi:hypothetical protein
MGSEPILPREIWVALLFVLTYPSWPLPQFPDSTKHERLESPDPSFPSPTPDYPPTPLMFNDDIYPHPPSKDYLPQPLYVRQPYSIQIIQLVECSSPPPQHKYSPSRISSSSYSDDSQSDGSAYDSSSSSLSGGGESYCSSSAVDSAAPVPLSFDHRDPSIDDTYRTRQRRVSLWRDAVHSKDVANSGSSVALSYVSIYRAYRNCQQTHTTTQLVPLLRHKSEKIPMAIWPTANRS